MSNAEITAPRTVTRRSNAPRSPLAGLGRIIARTIAILLAAGLVVLGAYAVGHTSLVNALPATFLPSGGDRRDGPPVGAGQQAAPATATDQTGAQAQPGQRPQGRPAGGTAQAPGGSARGQQSGLFSGRNAPSLLRGLPEEIPNLAIFAALTAAAALVLRVVRPRRRRSSQPRLSTTA